MTDKAPAPKFCSECGAPLSPTAKFCHACGHQVGAAGAAVRIPPQDSRRSTAAPSTTAVDDIDDGLDHTEAPLVTRAKGPAAALPWLLGLAGLIIGAAYLKSTEPKSADPSQVSQSQVAPFATGASGASGASGANGAAPPDIANMSPNERANRLYGRIMAFVQAGKADSAAFFAPMAMAAHEMLDNPSIDERYHLGQINEMLGNAAAAAAHADTILKAEPENLLGLMLATHAARLANKAAEIKTYDGLFLKVLDAQLATKKPEYDMHKAEIDRTAAEARSGK